jgi:PAS domain-containing protein
VIQRAERRALAAAALASTADPLRELGGYAVLSAVEELRLVLEELRAADEELRVQNAELDTALRCAQSEHARAYGLFECAPIALFHTDTAGVIREANRNAERLIGRGRAHLMEMPLVMFIHAGEKRAFRDRLRLVLTEDGPQTWESVMGWAKAPVFGAVERLMPCGRPMAVLITAEAARPEDGDGVPAAAEGIRWAVQDLQGLPIARGE